MAIHSERSIPNILAGLLMQLMDLVRKEGELARTEVSEKVGRLGGSIALIVVGAVLMMPALVVLFDAAVMVLVANGLSPSMAALAVGGAALIIGLILLSVGLARLRPKHLVPERIIHQLQEDASVAKAQVRTNHDYQRAA